MLNVSSYKALLSIFSLISLSSVLANADDGLIETIIYKDSQGLEHEEYAFRAPMKGYPKQVIQLYCANVRLRLYWGGYRDQVKDSLRKGIYLRRMSRLAKHIFEDIRDIDRPYNATMVSVVDEYFGVRIDDNKSSYPFDKVKNMYANKKKSIRDKILGKKRRPADDDSDDEDEVEKEAPNVQAIDDIDELKELEQQGDKSAVKRLKSYAAELLPKVALGIYTRWLTMWWMMMSCLYTKYYLWDPALDEFIKLKRSLVMYPDLQLVKLQDVECKTTRFFKRIIDVCKILNPLMNIDFGQLSLDKLTRFKGDAQ